jgi:ABC-2 type transport system ATP-binding protein
LASQLGRNLRLEIEVATGGVPAALQVLRTKLDLPEPAHDNGTISVPGANWESIPDLVDAMVAAGVRIYRVTPQEPSLEDVYFALHGEKDGES